MHLVLSTWMPSPPSAGSDLQSIREDPAGQAASEKQSSPVQAVPSTMQAAPQHVDEAKKRASAGSLYVMLEEFWFEVLSSSTCSPAMEKPVVTSVFPFPRRAG
jgi:hypothetical protein